MDWEDEVRLAIEERVSLSPDALATGTEANLRFARPGDDGDQDLRPPPRRGRDWIFQRPNAVGERGALTMYRPARAAEVRLEEDVSAVVNNERIWPNNVDLGIGQEAS